MFSSVNLYKLAPHLRRLFLYIWLDIFSEYSLLKEQTVIYYGAVAICTLVGHIICNSMSCVLLIANKEQQIRTQIRWTDVNVQLAVRATDKAKMKV